MTIALWRAAALGLGIGLTCVSASAQSAPAPMPPTIAAARDEAYPGTITLDVDVADVARGIFRVRENIPVASAGQLTLFYPQWLPGNHAPRGPINHLAGIEISANGARIPWRRDAVNMYAFHVDVPAGVSAIEARFQFLSPTAGNQGRIVATPELLNLQWNTVVLYPAGHYVSRIRIAPSVTLPEGWSFAAALDGASTQGQVTRFAETDLMTLVDSPMFAGRHARRVELAPNARTRVTLNLFADRADQLEASEDQLRPHRELVRQAYRLFGSHHYDHYDFLFGLSDRLSGIGLEHHRSSENAVGAGFFTDWDEHLDDRELLPHEVVHSWNGKFRRPADLWTADYNTPMRNSLLWVYEGQTQYWGHVLTARSGLWNRQDALDSLAHTAATYDTRVGRNWRALGDTTNDPIVSLRRPQPWRSWQRSEDYYSEGLLIWLDADTLIRERSNNRRSLDDFARAFFGGGDGSSTVSTYTFEDVVAALNAVQPYDWAAFLRARVEAVAAAAPLDGVTRGGWRLAYSDERSNYFKQYEANNEVADFMFSIGAVFDKTHNVTQVQWDGPAFNQGLTVAAQAVAVNGNAFSAEALRRAITAARDNPAPIELLVKNGDQYRSLAIDYHDGLRYPRFERVAGTPDRLGAILASRAR
ncbi:MAG TPA: peptidase M61 [Hyphomonadaceae bacterium]|nr:peptidase M61 [Hyphomonadaceae bacterium]